MSEGTTKTANCAKCGKEMSDMEATFLLDNDDENVEERICQQCSEDVSNEYAEQTQNINYIGALVGALVGAAIGVGIWYFVAVTFDLTIGYVAMAIGWLVGFGAMFASGKKRGMPLQILSLVITALAIFIAEYLVFVYALNYFFDWPSFEWVPIGEFIQFAVELEVYTFVNYVIWGLGLVAAFVTPQARKLKA